MFKIGDAVVHPAKGAGIVTGVKRMPGLKKRSQSYRIKLVGTRAKTILMIPVEKAVDSGLRPAISEANLERVWRALSAESRALPVEHKERYELLKDRLRAGNIVQTAEVIRDLEWRKLSICNRKLNAPGERIYQKAMHMLTRLPCSILAPWIRNNCYECSTLEHARAILAKLELCLLPSAVAVLVASTGFAARATPIPSFSTGHF